MKCLLALLALLPVQEPDGWWDGNWRYRRRIAIRNPSGETLKAGFQVQVEIDPDYLGLARKARPDLSDLALVHSGRAIPFSILPGRSPGRRLLWFRAAGDLPSAATDGRYALYYGNPQAPPRPEGAVFDFFEDFSRPETFKERFQADPGLTLALEGGALVVRDAAGRTPEAPARLLLKGVLPAEDFSLSLDLEIDAANASPLGVSLNIALKEPGGEDPKTAGRVDELVGKLGDADWETREQATRELVRIGRPAVPKLLEAAKSGDPEVKWRAEHALREIGERSPSPAIAAGVVVGDPRLGPVALTHAIGKNRGLARHGGGWPLRLHVTLQRDPDGDVTVLWNVGKPQTGHLPGEVDRISLDFHKGAPGLPGTVRVDNILLRRHGGEDRRPVHAIEIEETAP